MLAKPSTERSSLKEMVVRTKHAHTHPVAVYGGIDPYDHSIWIPADKPLMEAAHGLLVCKMKGWEESYGIKVEIEHFEAEGKPVHYLEDANGSN